MRILAVLWTVCLVRLCSAGSLCCFRGSKTDDDEVTDQAEQESSNEVSTENLRAVPPQPTEPKEEDATEAPQSVPSEGYPQELDAQSAGHVDPTPISLDLASPDKDKSQSFDYYFGTNAVQLIVPKKGVSVSKLMNGTENIYTLSSEETFQYAKVYLNKDGKPELALITLGTSSGHSQKAYSKNGSKWEPCTDSNAKMNGLRTPTGAKLCTSIDLSLETSTDNCTIFEVDLLGVKTRQLYPKLGYLATKVMDANKELWECSKGSNACLSCLIYKHGNNEVLEILVVDNDSLGYNYFVKNDKEWKNVTKEDFLKRLSDMKKGIAIPPPKEPSQEFPNPTTSTLVPHEEPTTPSQSAVPPSEQPGAKKKASQPYIIDLNSTNGTFLNDEKIEPSRYYELREKDVLKFGHSSREYVLMHDGPIDA
ncbi:signal peptide-containing protein [Theileria equi strain WA]|uniref:Signal peptide-containing protein n=1 Tax=Theileria equi strain WA TaxID=1537102 RepID=L0AWE6_THEEQ|nr:signal peptide-containing protein [Theileria equi strain WA]AFZ79870.1 signal peptide-containing protein [Theileria equi strain WA]|eukprot:XP_004829536.1 signal peptide-containing protein [Theileria equi strain WA]